MNAPLTGPTQPTAPPAAQPVDDQRIDRIANAFSQALDQATATPTAFRDETPVPAIGNALPVPQPGRTPMSQRATDASVLILSAGAASIPLGGMTALIIYALGNADPVSLAVGAGAPITLAVPILALTRLVRRAKETVQAAPPVIHQHYTGTVVQDQRTVNTTTRGMWASTRNQLPK
ncbi:hypothetical protein [Streptomyces violaceorubidus]|uniref:hypothetical protein n=1 Tax=Streptomyces violaceorubidus TaxID=284042 RepID=UPI0004BE9F03|nr:hypothetical protein [Streptomyces violaceorubidus]